jgi:chromosome segregation ATPase
MTDAKPLPSERIKSTWSSGYGPDKEYCAILDELWSAVFPEREKAPPVSEARDGGDAVEMLNDLSVLMGKVAIQPSCNITHYVIKAVGPIIAAIEAERERKEDCVRRATSREQNLRDALAAEKRAHNEALAAVSRATDSIRRLDLERDELRAKLEEAERERDVARKDWERASAACERWADRAEAAEAKLRAQSSDGMRAAVQEEAESCQRIAGGLKSEVERGIAVRQSADSKLARCDVLENVAGTLFRILAAHPSPSEAVESELQSRIEAAAQVLRDAKGRQHGYFTAMGDALEALGFDRDGNEVGK